MALLFAFGYFPPEWPMNGCPNQHFESVATPQETALHAPAASQHAGATFDSSPKLLRALEAPAFLVGCALGGLRPPRCGMLSSATPAALTSATLGAL
jgi:hypothetical protein